MPKYAETLQTALSSQQVMLRLPQVLVVSGLSRTTFYLYVTNGLMTSPVSLGARAVGWPSGEIAALNAARISGVSEARIRQLVSELHHRRERALTVEVGA